MSRSNLLSTLLVVFVIALVSAVTAISLQPHQVLASSQDQIGRYQISSWAAYAGEKVHHSGYFVLDTATGKVVDRGHEIHGIGAGGRD